MATVTQIKKKAQEQFNIKSAGEHLLYRFQSDKPILVNDKDRAALRCVLGWVNSQTLGNVNNNQLFAKLYIYDLTMRIRKYETTVLDSFPVDELHRLLNKPLASFYKAFHVDLHMNQLNKLNKYNEFNQLIDAKIADLKAKKIKVPVYKNNSKKVSDITNGLREMTDEEVNEAVKEQESKKISKEQQEKVVIDFNRYQETFTEEFVMGKLNDQIGNVLNNYS